MPHRETTIASPIQSVDRDVIAVTGLTIATADGSELVRNVSLRVPHGSTLGIVGESGSGKSLTCRAILGILPEGLEITGGRIDLDGTDLSTLTPRQWRELRGSRVSAVFQDPASYLNPSLRVGVQLAEVLRVKVGLSRRAAKVRSIELLDQMGLHEPASVARQYPFELSGGMLQRVLIAIALAADPEVLIADEATTALDVTVQAEVLDLLEDLRRDRGLTLIIVSHDFAVVSQLCDQIVVLKDGEIVEGGSATTILTRPQHPYTRLLIDNHHEYGVERYFDEEPVSA